MLAVAMEMRLDKLRNSKVRGNHWQPIGTSEITKRKIVDVQFALTSFPVFDTSHPGNEARISYVHTAHWYTADCLILALFGVKTLRVLHRDTYVRWH